MKKIIAVPTLDGKLCEHFGRCEAFAIIETENNTVKSKSFYQPPAHEPGAYPKFLADKGVSAIIAGGMGMKAKQIFARNNIEVCIGVSSDMPEKLVEEYLSNSLKTGQNQCDGGEHGHGKSCNH